MSTRRIPSVLVAVLVFAARAARGMDGIEMNGIEMNGVSLTDVSIGGTSVTGVHLAGSTFTGTRRDGTVVTGDGFVGAKLKGWTVSGASVLVRIDGYSQAGDVSTYDASFQLQDGDGRWQPVCTTGGDAIPLYGTWGADGSRTASETLITFACSGGALAKCVNFGYAPWRSQNGTSLAAYHQACTRALRADYCGDGTSYTQNGKVIDLYDAIGVLDDAAAWTPEAEWNEAGAACMSGLAARATVPVTCEAAKVQPLCGASGPSAGSLLVTELP